MSVSLNLFIILIIFIGLLLWTKRLIALLRFARVRLDVFLAIIPLLHVSVHLVACFTLIFTSTKHHIPTPSSVC